MPNFERFLQLVQADLDALPDPVENLQETQAGDVAERPQTIRVSSEVDSESSHRTVNANDKFAVDDSTTGSASAPEPQHVLPPCPLERGQLSPPGTSFCPLIAMSKFPYTFVSSRYSEAVARKYFAGGKFWGRKWELFYLWTFEDHPKPLILVPESHVRMLLDQIDLSFPDFAAHIPDLQDLEISFCFPFFPRITPRYLGRSATHDQYREMERAIPPPSFQLSSEASSSKLPDDRSLEAFKRMTEKVMESNKNKAKSAKAQKKKQRILQQQYLLRQLKRLQRYLGLRPKRSKCIVRRIEINIIDFSAAEDPIKTPGLSWPELQAAREAYRKAAQIPPLDYQKPPLYPPDRSVVFIAFDVEAYEKDHEKITEIGVSVLDTLDLVDVAPGRDGKQWHGKIRTRHFRIKEYQHLQNKEYVNGCPDRFEFGSSEFIDLEDAPHALASCFKPPYFAHPRAPNFNAELKRDIVLVGHDISCDINFLHRIGYNPLNLPNVLECFDTASIDRTWRRSGNTRSLGNILNDFDLLGWNLHNAGNDAHYTMQVLLALAVRMLEEKNTVTDGEKVAALNKKIHEATEVAKERILESAEGWSTENEGEDGGPANKAGNLRG